MGKTFNFYKSCKDKGTWCQQFPEHQKSIALSVVLKNCMGSLKIIDQLCIKLKQVQERRQEQFKRQDPKDAKRDTNNCKNSKPQLSANKMPGNWLSPRFANPGRNK